MKLPPREHFFAHQLLVKIYPNNHKLVYALNMMCVGGIRSGHFRSSKRYGWIREKFIQNHPCKDNTTKDKISQSLKVAYQKDPSILIRQVETKRKNGMCRDKRRTMIEKPCDCGCGEILYYRKGDRPKKYVKGHQPKRVYSVEEKKKLSLIHKNRLSRLTKKENLERMKKSALIWQSDTVRGELRGKRISESKKGKSPRVKKRD